MLPCAKDLLDPAYLIVIDETALYNEDVSFAGALTSGTRVGYLCLRGIGKPRRSSADCADDARRSNNRRMVRRLCPQGVAPTLSPSDVLILDNLLTHKGAEVREIVKAVGGRLLLLPSYNPDFNPIENIFAKMKAWIRRVPPNYATLQCSATDNVRHRQPAACCTTAGYEPYRQDYTLALQHVRTIVQPWRVITPR